jgi:hypothetical protein
MFPASAPTPAVSAMSQQRLQHKSHQEPGLAPSEQSDSRLPRPSTHTAIVAALALTAVLLTAATAYVAAYARVACNEYHRQQLLETAQGLEKSNTRLRLQADAARAALRPVEVALAYDLTIADPSTQVDYVRVPQAQAAEPPAPGNARLAAVASWLVALVTFEARAQASSLQTADSSQVGR